MHKFTKFHRVESRRAAHRAWALFGPASWSICQLKVLITITKTLQLRIEIGSSPRWSWSWSWSRLCDVNGVKVPTEFELKREENKSVEQLLNWCLGASLSFYDRPILVHMPQQCATFVLAKWKFRWRWRWKWKWAPIRWGCARKLF